jgi:hypothetical protein
LCGHAGRSPRHGPPDKRSQQQFGGSLRTLRPDLRGNLVLLGGLRG